MYHPAPTQALALAVALSANPAIGFGAERLWDVDLGAKAIFEADIGRERSKTPGLRDRKFDRDRFSERFALLADGFFGLDELVRFRLRGEVGYLQERLDFTGAGSDNDRSRVYEYDTLIDLFSQQRTSISFFATQSEDRAFAAFGGADTESSTNSRGGTIRYRGNRSNAAVTRSKRSASFETKRLFVDRPDGSVAVIEPGKRDEDRTLNQFDWSFNDDVTLARLRLSDEDVSDSSSPRVPDFDLQQADGSLTHRWGHYLEHLFRTSFLVSHRDGDFDRDTWSSSSVYSWQVTEDFGSDARYHFDRYDNDGRVTTTNDGELSFEHQLYDSLRSRVRTFGDHVSREDGSRYSLGGGGSADYRKRLPGQTILRADLFGEYRVQDNDFDLLDRTTLLSFAEDVTRQTLPFLRVVDETIVVFSNETDALLTRGIDYTVLETGDRTEIELLPSGAVTPPGEIRAEYQTREAGDLRFSNRKLGGGIGLESSWFVLAAQYEQSRDHTLDRDEDFEGDQTAFLDDSHWSSYRLQLRRRTPELQSSANAEFSQRRSRTFDEDTFTLSGDTLWRVRRTLTANAFVSYVSARFDKPDRESDTLTGRAALVWRPRPNSRLRLFADYRRIDDSLAPDQDWLVIGLVGKLDFGRLDISPVLRWSRRERGDNEVTEFRGILRLVWSI